MSLWDDRFRNHQIHSTLASVRETLEDTVTKFDDPAIAESWSRLKTVISFIETKVSALDPLMVPLEPLDKINSRIGNVATQLRGFLDTNDINQLVGANENLDQILIELQRIPRIETRSDLKGLSDRVSAFHKSISELLNDLTQQKNLLNEEFKAISEQISKANESIEKQEQTIETQKGRLDEAISAWQGQFSEAQEQNRNKFTDASEKRTENFNKVISEAQIRMNTFFGEHQQKAEDLFSKYEDQVNSGIAKLGETAKEFFSQYEEEAKKAIEILDKKKEEAANLVNLISDIAVTGNYDVIANQERKVADRLRILALALMGVMIAAAFWTVSILGQHAYDWHTALIRIFTTLIVGIPAVYAARESEKHRFRERHNRRFQLELAAIGPYLANLKEEKQEELKEKLTERFFGRSEDITEKVESLKGSPLISLLDKALELLSKK